MRRLFGVQYRDIRCSIAHKKNSLMIQVSYTITTERQFYDMIQTLANHCVKNKIGTTDEFKATFWTTIDRHAQAYGTLYGFSNTRCEIGFATLVSLVDPKVAQGWQNRLMTEVNRFNALLP